MEWNQLIKQHLSVICKESTFITIFLLHFSKGGTSCVTNDSTILSTFLTLNVLVISWKVLILFAVWHAHKLTQLLLNLTIVDVIGASLLEILWVVVFLRFIFFSRIVFFILKYIIMFWGILIVMQNDAKICHHCYEWRVWLCM